MKKIMPYFLLFFSFIILSSCTTNAPIQNDVGTLVDEILPTESISENIPLPTGEVTTAVSIEPYCSDGQLITEQLTPLRYTVQVINQYPHDPNAFTQGLFYLNGRFYESTGIRGQSTVRQLNIESGVVEKSIANLDSEFGEGAAVFNNQLYQLTWQSGVGYVYDLDSFEQLRSFSYAGEGWGLTTNGRCLIMSNGSSNLTYRDPSTFEILGTLPVQDNGAFISQLNELEFIQGEIWANVWKQNRIARISPTTGQLLGWINATPLVEIVQPNNSQAVLNGIAFDEENGRIFLTGKLWPTIFEVNIFRDN